MAVNNQGIITDEYGSPTGAGVIDIATGKLKTKDESINTLSGGKGYAFLTQGQKDVLNKSYEPVILSSSAAKNTIKQDAETIQRASGNISTPKPEVPEVKEEKTEKTTDKSPEQIAYDDTIA